MHFSDLIPPIFIKLRDKLRKREPLFNQALFSTYEDAKAACGVFGYEESELIDMVYRKTEVFRNQFVPQNNVPVFTDSMIQSLIGILFLINETKQDEIRVIDLGGACGAHYFAMRAALNNRVKLRWHVVETSTMVRKAKIFETDSLRFFDSLSSAQKAFDRAHLLHSSGTIQYVPNTQRTMQEILELRLPYIFLNRLALTSGEESIISTQESMLSANGPGPLPVGIQDRLCKYPVIYYPKHTLEEMIREKYSIVFRFGESSTQVINDETIITTGYFAERS